MERSTSTDSSPLLTPGLGPGMHDLVDRLETQILNLEIRITCDSIKFLERNLESLTLKFRDLVPFHNYELKKNSLFYRKK